MIYHACGAAHLIAAAPFWSGESTPSRSPTAPMIAYAPNGPSGLQGAPSAVATMARHVATRRVVQGQDWGPMQPTQRVYRTSSKAQGALQASDSFMTRRAGDGGGGQRFVPLPHRFIHRLIHRFIREFIRAAMHVLFCLKNLACSTAVRGSPPSASAAVLASSSAAVSSNLEVAAQRLLRVATQRQTSPCRMWCSAMNAARCKRRELCRLRRSAALRRPFAPTQCVGHHLTCKRLQTFQDIIKRYDRS